MKKYFTKEYILLAVSVFTTLFCIVGLSFDLVGTKLNSSRYIENGFMLLDCNSFFITSSYGWATILLGIINWITLVTCVALGALAIVGHFRIKTKSRPIYLSSIIRLLSVHYFLLHLSSYGLKCLKSLLKKASTICRKKPILLIKRIAKSKLKSAP